MDGLLLFYDPGSTDGARGGGNRGSMTIRTDSNGRFVVDVPSNLNGSYDVLVRVRGVVSRERDRVLLGPSVAAGVDFGTAEPGDVDFDEDVDLADATPLKAAFGKRSGESGYNALADADGDGVVTLLDVSLFTRAFGRRGPEVVPS